MLTRVSSPRLLTTDHTPSQIDVIGSHVTAAPFNVLVKMILEWARGHKSKFVCVANTHMLVEAYQRPSFGDVLKSADMVTPDGMPLVWMLKWMGVQTQDRVAGLDLMQGLCQQASEQKVSIFFLGSQSQILQKMKHRLAQEFPGLLIAGMEPLPFRPLTPAEDQALIQQVNASGAGLVMIALGCPKQEHWMAVHKNRIKAVMIGLGGAFPVYAGLHRRAPAWMRTMGLEWFYRLIQEPRRLWARYATTIPVFIYLALRQIWHRFIVSD
ncbi:WecB/TagA/CpsF family glycosyltransferase [Acaryochloris sp. IP29b_bin.148]|uniref:WecB/TagA/CpsF family glycosyltransferase n=1 Tax=Acaryochloris sp. IP29b_bin.148 TaxID=2969218 RepID=UPI002633762E|nr:WecB/TagA/CpsF family glycosyltransferase [Acaryochloris sp. IP29b_bin.148]